MASSRRLSGQAVALSVEQVADAFWRFARTYYRRPDGRHFGGELFAYRSALRILIRLYGKTPLKWGNCPGTNRRRRPKRRPGTAYTTASYRRAIARACGRAAVASASASSYRRHIAAQALRPRGVQAERGNRVI